MRKYDLSYLSTNPPSGEFLPVQVSADQIVVHVHGDCDMHGRTPSQVHPMHPVAALPGALLESAPDASLIDAPRLGVSRDGAPEGPSHSAALNSSGSENRQFMLPLASC
jgi:hypothetical protein